MIAYMMDHDEEMNIYVDTKYEIDLAHKPTRRTKNLTKTTTSASEEHTRSLHIDFTTTLAH
jgi:hypothetical protein